MTVWRNKALACRPSFKLIQNLGFGEDATHTLNAASPLATLEASERADAFDLCQRPVIPDRLLERYDEKIWADIKVRTVAVLIFPWLIWLKARMELLVPK